LTHAGVVFSAAFWLSSGNLAIGLMSAAVLLSIPINYTDSLSVNPRPLGSLVFTSVIFISLLFPGQFSIIPLGVLYALLLMSHKLSSQVSWIVLGALALTIPNVTWTIALAVPLGFLLAIFGSGGFYLRVIREHIGYLRFHVKFGDFYGRKSFTHPLALLKTDPYLLILGLSVVFAKIYYAPLLVWVLSTCTFAFLWRYGDGYRFASLISGGLSVAIGLWSTNVIISGASFLVISFCLWKQATYLRGLGPPFLISSELVQAFGLIREESNERVLCIPVSYSYACAYFTKKVIVAGDASLTGLRKGIELLEMTKTPEGLKRVIEENQVELVLLERRVNGQHVEKLMRLGFEEIRNDNSQYGVFRRTPSVVIRPVQGYDVSLPRDPNQRSSNSVGESN
jgi:hypothetical protein